MPRAKLPESHKVAPGLSNPQHRWRRSPVLAQNRPWRFPFGPNTL